MKVMVPVDFSPVSARALQCLSQFAERAAIEAHLVHVIQVNSAEWAGSAESSETLDHQALQNKVQDAERQLKALKQHLPYPVQTRVLFGGLITGLLNYAAGVKPDLMVMGTHGADGLLERLSGSEAQHIVRYSLAPVLTVHENASLTSIKNLLWVAYFQEEQPVPEVLTKLQMLFGAKLHLLRILKPGDNESEADILLQMRQFAKRQDLQNYELHLHIDSKVPHGVRTFNQATQMDLVIIGTHARSSLSQLFFGSIAESLVNHCIRPLLTYHLH